MQPFLRRLPLIALFLLVTTPVLAQPVPDWVGRWMSDQRAAHRGLVSVELTEKAVYRIERTDGTRNLRMESVIGFGREPAGVDRRATLIEVNGRRRDPETPEQRERRTANQSRNDPQRDSDRLVRPLYVIEAMRASGEPEVVDLDGRRAVRISMTAVDPEFAIPRLTVWYDRDSATLLQIRAFIGGQGGTALDVLVQYNRVDGLDLPMRRRTEGSFTTRRRERDFSSLVDVRADYTDPRVERG